jgi:glutamate synthase domain-containing protein 2
MGEDAHSPPRHAEFDDVSGLFDFIDHVRSITKKPTGIKTCAAGCMSPGSTSPKT